MILLLATALVFSQETAVEKDGVRLSLDGAPSFSAPSLTKARTDQEGLRIGRLSFAKPGWFMNASVPAGDYRLVIEAPRRDLHLSLRTDQGETVASGVFWIDPPDAARPKPDLAVDEGAVLVTIACNDVRLTWRWVPKDRLEAAAKGERRAGKHVELISDLDRPDLEAALLQEVDAAAELQAALIGRSPPAEPIRIHLLRDEKTYAAVDKLVTGGRFLRNGGFASPLTRQTYVWYASRTDPADMAGVGAPLILRATLLHEFHHVLCYSTRPESVVWPTWLVEGLAEEAAAASLGARSAADADAYRDYTKGRWRHSESVGSLPTVDDLLGAYAGSDLGGWYSSAFNLVSRLGPERRRALLDAISAEEMSLPASVAAREYLDLRAGGARALWEECRRDLLRGDAPPLSVFGQTDRCADGFRMTCSEKGSGRLILQDHTYGPDVVLESRFAWQPCGERQADFYLAYAAGKEVTTFLKVAVLPKRVVLFRFIDNRWIRWGLKDFPEALAESAEQKAWHSVRLQLQGRDRRLAVDVDRRQAEFPLPEYVPSEATRVGVGVYNSTVYFSDVRAK